MTVQKPMKRISAQNVHEVKASDVVPGMITVDGLVVHVNEGLLGTVVLEHRNVNVNLNADDTVQVYAQIDQDMVDALQQAVADETDRDRRMRQPGLNR